MRSKRRLLRTAAAALMAVMIVMAPCAAAMGSDTGIRQSAESESAVPEESDTEMKQASDDAAGAGSWRTKEAAPLKETDSGQTEGESAPREEAGSGRTQAESAPQEEAGSGQTQAESAPQEETKAASAREPAASEKEPAGLPEETPEEISEEKPAAVPEEKPAAVSEKETAKSAGTAAAAVPEEKNVRAEPEQKAVKKRALDAASEPDWLSGGTGEKKDISEQLDALFGEESKIMYWEYDLGRWATVTFDVELSEGAGNQKALCLDPLKISTGVSGTKADYVYEYSTPMLVKAMYYGVGPGNSVLKDIIIDVTGSTKDLDEICNVVTHVSLSQIYAKLHEADPSMGTLKSKYGDGFFATFDLLKELVNRYGNKIAGMYVPDDYYVYVTALDNMRTQDFGFGAYRIRFPKADIRLRKSSGESRITEKSGLYSLAGAQYGVFSDPECTQKAGTLITGEDGTSDLMEAKVGETYYIKETAAPNGYLLDSKVYEVTPSKDEEVCTLEVEDQPVAAKVSIEIRKKSRKPEASPGKSLEGTEFTIRYFNGYYEPDALPADPEKTWVIKAMKTEEGCLAQMKEENRVSGEFYTEGDDVVLPLGTIAITESKAVEGFINDGEFGEGIRTFVGQIRLNDEKSAAELVAIRGTPSLQTAEVLRFEVEDTPEEEKPGKKNPEIGTTAADRDTGAHIGAPDETVTIDDTVAYKDLEPGAQYIMRGRLIDRSSREAVRDRNGREVTAEEAFTADASGAGRVVITFSFETGESLKGKTLVAYETAVEAKTGKKAASHENPDDEGQSIHFPEGSTTALDSETGDHIAYADEKVTIIDTVTYKNLVPGLTYRVEGVLMDADTGKPVLSGGEKIVSVREFTPQKESGTVTMEFEFDGTGLGGRRTVVFEKVKYGETSVFVHEDLKDEGQSIAFPSVRTSAKDSGDGDRTVRSEKDVKIKDVVRFTNLIPGREYVLRGILMDKKTENPLRTGRDIVTGEKTFVPNEPDGTVELEITLNASAVKKGDVVFFEDLYEVNPDTGIRAKVGSHRDINDAEQTLHFTGPDKPGRSADTGDENDPGTIMAVLFLCAIMLSAAVLGRREKEE